MRICVFFVANPSSLEKIILLTQAPTAEFLFTLFATELFISSKAFGLE